MDKREFNQLADSLCDVCRLFGQRQWCLATSGNFSVRTGDSRCLITQSGKDKSCLVADDLMLCTLDGQAVDENLTSSAETALHTCLYRHDPDIAAVLHTHSVAATVMSRAAAHCLDIAGYEMQKAMPGISTHEAELSISVFDNAQDMRRLVAHLEEYLAGSNSLPGFLIRGHGLYAWGTTLAEAQRHIEGLEFLLACMLEERRR